MADNPRIDDLRKRLEKDPGSRLFAQLAEELRKEGDLAEAIRVAREGLEKHPAYPSARMTLGRALFDTGDVASARAEFESVLKGAPDNILASRTLAECLEKLGDLPGALARYKTTLLMAPGDKQVQARLQEVEQRLQSPAPAPPASAAPAPTAAAAPPAAGPADAELPLVDAEPAPIPLSPVSEDSFELEQPHERDLSVTRPMMPGAPPALAPTAEPTPAAAGGEAPIPVVAAEEPFELERPYEAVPPRSAPPMPVAAAPSPAAAPAAPPAAAPAEPEREVDFEFEVPASTLPFQPRARVLLEDEVAPTPAHVGAAVPPLAAPPAAQPAPAAVPAPAADAAGEIVSSTLAELYFNQGFHDKAVEVYRQLVSREPENLRARARLDELEGQERQEAAVPVAAGDPRTARRQALERTIVRLEALLAAVKRG